MILSVTSTLSAGSTSLVAHQGGWDEILLVAGPIAVIVALLAVVKRRIDAHTRLSRGDQGPIDDSASANIRNDSLD